MPLLSLPCAVTSLSYTPQGGVNGLREGVFGYKFGLVLRREMTRRAVTTKEMNAPHSRPRG
jgi:hypothetical protein